MILKLLPEKRIKIGVSAPDWREVVEKSGKLLLDDDLVEPEYIEAMKDSIIDNGPYVVIGEGIALLHARPEDGVKELGMSLLTLEEPVEFGHPDHDPVKIAFAFCALDNKQHLEAISQLSEVLLVEDSVDRIHGMSKPQEVRIYIADVLEKVKRG